MPHLNPDAPERRPTVLRVWEATPGNPRSAASFCPAPGWTPAAVVVPFAWSFAPHPAEGVVLADLWGSTATAAGVLAFARYGADGFRLATGEDVS